MEWIVEGEALAAFIGMIGLMIRGSHKLDKKVQRVYGRLDEDKKKTEKNMYIKECAM